MTFSHLQVKNDEDLKYQYLLDVALTCKDFLDIALNTLWDNLNSLLPLLELLPATQLENETYVCANVHVFL